MFVVYISFFISSTLSIRLIVLFSFFNIKIKLIRLFFAKILLRRCVSFSIKKYYFVNVVIEIISNAFFFLDL